MCPEKNLFHISIDRRTFILRLATLSLALCAPSVNGADRKPEWADIFNIYKFTRHPVLLCFNAGNFGSRIEDWSDVNILNGAMNMLRTLYGNEIPGPDNYLITRWGKDEYTYRSYSSIAPGASPADREALAKPMNDVLFFAGEATHSAFAATVHGAILTGYRSAREIIEVHG